MSLLEITGLSHTCGEQILYRDGELTLNRGEHMGVVGRNGAGKSTLLKICAGEVIPDGGRVLWQPRTAFGCLDQQASIDPDQTAEGFLRSAFLDLYELEAEMNRLYGLAAAGDSTRLSAAARLQEQLEARDFYSVDTRLNQVASGLGLTALGLDRPVAQMSGGQRAKLILAKLLLEQPDVLLLDEPTNFLDQEHVAWLAGYLSGLERAYMVVSHDGAFLERIANRICDIDGRGIRKYCGTYREFLHKKELLREDYARQYAGQQKEIKKTEAFIRKNIAGRNAAMAKGRRKQLDRLERLQAPEQAETAPRFDFAALPLTGTGHLRAEGLAVGYQFPLLSGLDLTLKGGEKAVITGFNGIGKTTLMRTLTGQLPPLKGSFAFSAQVTLGYYEQDLLWPDPARTPLQILGQAFPQMTEKEARARLARCGLAGAHALQPVGTLSGGEQAKTRLCLLAMSPSNFLILDEPTNHLDPQAREALRRALKDYPGTVLLVSHEPDFYRGWIQRVISL